MHVFFPILFQLTCPFKNNLRATFILYLNFKTGYMEDLKFLAQLCIVNVSITSLFIFIFFNELHHFQWCYSWQAKQRKSRIMWWNRSTGSWGVLLWAILYSCFIIEPGQNLNSVSTIQKSSLRYGWISLKNKTIITPCKTKLSELCLQLNFCNICCKKKKRGIM